MRIVGITGSIASGKTTVANLIAGRKYPLFNADKIVSSLYKKKRFINILIRIFKLKSSENIKNQLKLVLEKNKKKFSILEKIVHPMVRQEMKTFLKKKNKFLILEIPLLVENKLNKYFDKLIFVNSKKKLRLQRYLKKKGNKKTFNLLNNRQLPSGIKKKMCDYTINNNNSLTDLKKAAKNFIKNYE